MLVNRSAEHRKSKVAENNISNKHVWVCINFNGNLVDCYRIYTTVLYKCLFYAPTTLSSSSFRHHHHKSHKLINISFYIKKTQLWKIYYRFFLFKCYLTSCAKGLSGRAYSCSFIPTLHLGLAQKFEQIV